MVSIGQSAASEMAKARAEASASGGGADIGPIMATGVPGMGLNVDGTRYFWFHHTDADTPDKLDRAEVQRCVAAMAVMAYIAADLEQSLPLPKWSCSEVR